MAFFIDHNHYQAELERLNDENKENELASTLTELAAYTRVNTLSTIYHAGRGWLGASLSAVDILAVLYFHIIDRSPGPDEADQVLLSKGHAAAAQYAALTGAGWLPVNELKRYKESDGPQAHTDVHTPGIAANSGSLGQTLSKAFGLAWRSKRMFHVILGDGELQEGQNYEALMSIAHHGVTNVLPIIDRNNIQSDSDVADVKKIHDLPAALRGFGFSVHHAEDGNDVHSLLKALTAARAERKPTIVIADTRKGAGVSFIESRGTPRRGYAWHGGVPSATEYRDALAELADAIRNPHVLRELRAYLDGPSVPPRPKPPKPAARQSTGDAYADQLLALAETRDDMVVLDADLEKSCRLTAFAEQFPDRFLEMGIAEQDMISTAGGLALGGRLPFVNTYAAFYRRGYEQLYMNSTERTKIVYAAHYSGLCYATDGKSHQCLGDVAMVRGVPNLRVVHPAFNEELPGILSWYLNEVDEDPLYLRLHRTPILLDAAPPADRQFHPGRGVAVRERGGRHCLLTAGPHMTAFCAIASDELEREGKRIDVHRVSSLSHLSLDYLSALTERYETVVVAEETIGAGGLFDEIATGLASLPAGTGAPRLFHIAPDDFTFSTLDPLGLYERFQLTPDHLKRRTFSRIRMNLDKIGGGQYPHVKNAFQAQ